MSSVAYESITKNFKYCFPTCTNKDILFKLEVPVEIPYKNSTKELVQRIINMFHIPVYLEEELNEKLAKFVDHETNTFHNERDEKLINQLKSGEIDVDNIVKSWEKLFKENVAEYAEPKGTSDEEVFANAYHKLVHSPALETILQVEGSYADTVYQTLKSKEQDISNLTKRQTEEMEDKVRMLNTFTTEEDINFLAGKHFEEQSLVAGRWGSQLDALCQTQRAQYRAWLMRTLEEHQTNSALNTPSNSPLGKFPSSGEAFPPLPLPTILSNNDVVLEESFTIHLGSQLKQTHNIRIVCMDMLRLCTVERTDNPADASRRLQTALGLYSSELCGLVLLADSPPSRPSALTQEFINICQSSTEYHFPDVEEQLRRIVDDVRLPAEKRNFQRLKDLTEGSQGQGEGGLVARRLKSGKDLQTGDVFITRHSNLAEVHVVYHMLAEESTLRSGEMSSRHPAILGLRNILKTCCRNEVSSLSVPVLLRHRASDEMTAAWCLRRAELVLKCVKGFMLETSTWGGADLTNVQFVVPQGISAEVFHSLAALLPTIFRVPNPLKFTSPSNA